MPKIWLFLAALCVAAALHSASALAAPLHPLQWPECPPLKTKAYKFSGLNIVVESYKTLWQKTCFTNRVVLVKKRDKVLSQVQFELIESLGGSNEVLPFKTQPLDGLFFLTKWGDYDTRYVVIDKQGQSFNLPGGDVFVSKDKNFVFTIRNNGIDAPELAVLDRKAAKITAAPKNQTDTISYTLTYQVVQDAKQKNLFYISPDIFEGAKTGAARCQNFVLNQNDSVLSKPYICDSQQIDAGEFLVPILREEKFN